MSTVIASERLSATCLLCGGNAAEWFQFSGFPIYECADCLHRFSVPSDVDNHVHETYSDSYFFGAGAGYDNYLDESELLITRGEQYASILADHATPGRILDVGSAAGFLLKGMVNSGWRGVGVEPNLRLSTYAREVLNVNSICGTLETFEDASSFNAVSMIQVISHFIDPCSTINKAVELLVPQGLLLIETWDRDSWTARAFGRRWHEYSPPSVLHWFSKARLTSLLRESKLDIVACGRPQRSIQIGHAKSLVQYKYGRFAAATLCWLPSNLKVPYFGDDLFWILARKK